MATALKSFNNWHTAWAVYAADDPAYMPTPDQVAFMDKYMGSGPVTVWCPEDAVGTGQHYPDDPGLVGNAIATCTTAKDDGTTDILQAHANGVFGVFGEEFMAGGVQMAYVKA